MHPRLFSFSALGKIWNVNGWEALVALAFLIGTIHVLWDRSIRRELGPYVIEGMAVIIGAGILASKYTRSLVYQGTLRGDVGLHFFGWAIGSVLGMRVYAAIRGLSFWRGFDLLAPGVILGSSIGRVGCLLEGCCHGFHCPPPWGLHMRSVFFGDGYFFPTQILSASIDLITFLLVVRVVKPKASFEGEVAITAIILYCSTRFLLEFARADPGGWGILSWPQWFALVFGIATILCAAQLKRAARPPGQPLRLRSRLDGSG